MAESLPPDEFFHGGARSYLTNNIGGALQWVTNGLAAYPKDEKLKKLEQLLKQQQQQQQQQNQDQPNDSKQDQQKNQNQKPDQQQKSPDQKQADKDKQQEQQKKDAQAKQDQKKDEQQAKKSDEQKKQDKENESEQQQGPAVAGEMTPQEAKQLLDAQKNDEMLMPVSRKDKPPDPRKVVKDW